MATRGWENVSETDLARRACQEKTAAPTSKYRNVRFSIDGLTFDSKKEANYYVGLKARAHNGEITDLRTQVSFPLFCPAPGGLTAVVAHYVADFVYVEHGVRHVVDVKGGKACRTQVYAIKRKWLELQVEGIVIEEV